MRTFVSPIADVRRGVFSPLLSARAPSDVFLFFFFFLRSRKGRQAFASRSRSGFSFLRIRFDGLFFLCFFGTKFHRGSLGDVLTFFFKNLQCPLSSFAFRQMAGVKAASFPGFLTLPFSPLPEAWRGVPLFALGGATFRSGGPFFSDRPIFPPFSCFFFFFFFFFVSRWEGA